MINLDNPSSTIPGHSANILHYTVPFPPGSMGLEFEAVIISSEKQIGCRIKDFYFREDHTGIDRDFLINTVNIGDIISQIEGQSVLALPFVDIIDMLKKYVHQHRRVLFKNISHPLKQGLDGNNSSDIRNFKANSSPEKVMIKGSNKLHLASPAKVNSTDAIETIASAVNNMIPLYSQLEMDRELAVKKDLLNELSRFSYLLGLSQDREKQLLIQIDLLQKHETNTSLRSVSKEQIAEDDNLELRLLRETLTLREEELKSLQDKYTIEIQNKNILNDELLAVSIELDNYRNEISIEMNQVIQNIQSMEKERDDIRVQYEVLHDIFDSDKLRFEKEHQRNLNLLEELNQWKRLVNQKEDMLALYESSIECYHMKISDLESSLVKEQVLFDEQIKILKSTYDSKEMSFIDSLKLADENYQVEHKRLNKKLDIQVSEINSLKSTLEEYHKLQESSKSQVDCNEIKLVKGIQDISDYVVSLQSSIVSLEDFVLHSIDGEFQSMKNLLLNSVNQKLIALVEMNSRLESNLSIECMKYIDLEAKYKDLETKMSSDPQMKETLLPSNADQLALISSYEMQVKTLSDQLVEQMKAKDVKSIQEQVELLESQLISKDAIVHDLKQQITILKSELETSHQALQAIELDSKAKVLDLKSEKLLINEKLLQAHHDLEESRSKSYTLQEEFSQMKLEYKQMLESSQDKLQDLFKIFSETSDQLVTSKILLEEMNEEKRGFEEKLNSYKDLVISKDNLLNQQAESIQEMEDVQRQLQRKLQQSESDLSNEIQSLQQELVHLRRDMILKEQECDELQTQSKLMLETIQAQDEALRNVDVLESDHEINQKLYTDTITKLKAQTQELEEALVICQGELEITQEALAEKSLELDNLTVSVSDLLARQRHVNRLDKVTDDNPLRVFEPSIEVVSHWYDKLLVHILDTHESLTFALMDSTQLSIPTPLMLALHNLSQMIHILQTHSLHSPWTNKSSPNAIVVMSAPHVIVEKQLRNHNHIQDENAFFSCDVKDKSIQQHLLPHRIQRFVWKAIVKMQRLVLRKNKAMTMKSHTSSTSSLISSNTSNSPSRELDKYLQKHHAYLQQKHLHQQREPGDGGYISSDTEDETDSVFNISSESVDSYYVNSSTNKYNHISSPSRISSIASPLSKSKNTSPRKSVIL